MGRAAQKEMRRRLLVKVTLRRTKLILALGLVKEARLRVLIS